MKARRADVNDTVKMSLLCDVQGACPLCSRNLIVRRSGKTVRVFDVAHIYPLNATEHERKILANEEILADDIDSEPNFMALCKKCHKIYDTQKTAEEYRQLVAIKKNINKAKELSATWDIQTLHRDISIVASKIGEMDEKSISKTKLSYDALKVSDKTDATFGMINEMKVSQYVLSFFVPIRESLKSLELQEKAKSAFIYSQVKSYYTLLLMKNYDQKEIFEKLCEWFMTNTGITERDKAEVLVSYFIQNCEVFSEC